MNTESARYFIWRLPEMVLVILLSLSGCNTTEIEANQPTILETAQTVEPIEFVAPEFRASLDAMRQSMESGGVQTWDADMLRKIRQYGPRGTSQFLAEPPVHERLIPGPAGAPDLRVFVMNAEKGASRPAILYIHGGGFILGDARTDMARFQTLALKHDCVIVSVDYRLAPETPFPGPVKDSYAALKWIAANSGELGVDSSRIAVMGESAGGGLAAMLALMARDRAEVPIDQQILIYPMLDDRTGSTVARPYWMGAYSWTPEANRFGWTSLLGVPAGSASVPPGSVPAREQNLAGLPPTFIAVGSIDLFVNEDIDYAQRLIDAGVPTELLVIPGGYHGFQRRNPETILAQRFNDAIDAAITRAFNPPQPAPQENGYSLDTPIARLLLNPQAKAILLKYMPDLVNGPAAQMVGGMSLKTLATMDPGNFNDETLQRIGSELAVLH